MIKQAAIALAIGLLTMAPGWAAPGRDGGTTPEEGGSSPAQVSFATPDGLFVMPPQGGVRQPLDESAEGFLNPVVWSADGQHLALVENYTDVYRLHWDATRKTKVFSSPCQQSPTLDLTWQGDNATLLIKQQCPGATLDAPAQLDLFLVDANGNLTALPPLPPQLESDVYISPDGTRLAYVASQHIYVAGLDGAAPQQITQEPGLYGAAGSPLVWSPDGQQIAFYEGSYPFQRINVVGVDGTNRRLLTPDPDFQIYRSRLSWSPDGRYMATYVPFSPPFSNQEVVMLITVATGEIQTITRPGFYSALNWSPDSQHLILAAGEQLERQALFLLDLATTTFTTLTPEPFQQVVDSGWSTQGDWIAFTAIAIGDDVGNQVLHVVRPDGTQLAALTAPNEYAYPFAWVPAP
ncbi:MAG: DPP IV N-terminal domain-containing protein [Nodosilinea sp.]